MDPLTWMLIGSGVGAGMGLLTHPEKQRQADEQRAMNAAAMYYSPWTGMKPDQLYTPDPSLLGGIVEGGLAGASFGGLLGSKFGEKAPPTTTTTESGTDSSSVGGSGISSKSAQVQIPTDDQSLYDRHQLQSTYAAGQGGPNHSPWMYFPTAPQQARYPGVYDRVKPPYQMTPPQIR